MADSTVIVQHICSVIIFICCFAGIIQERVSPIAVVSWGSLSTVLGWALWDFWVGQEEAGAARAQALAESNEAGEDGSSASSTSSSKETQGLGFLLSNVSTTPRLG